MAVATSGEQGCHMYRIFCVSHIFELNAQCRVCTHRLRIFVGYTDLTDFGVLHKFSVCGGFVYSALSLEAVGYFGELP